MKLDGNSDYDCNGICNSKASKDTCESHFQTCDYVRDDVPSYEVYSRQRKSLASACKWLSEGETQELEPNWKTKLGHKYLSGGTVLKTVDGVEKGIYYTLSESRDKTEKICLKECFLDPECTGVETYFSADGKRNDCELRKGELTFSKDGGWLSVGDRGFMITRNYG